jgi:hypothetical protein
MSILDVNLNDAEELKILPDNEEVQLRIARADVVPNKRDPSRNNLALTFDIPTDPMVDDIRVWIPIPTTEQKAAEPKQYTKQLNRLKEFCDAFGIMPPLETEEMLGRESWAVLREEEGMNGEMQNSVRRFITRR